MRARPLAALLAAATGAALAACSTGGSRRLGAPAPAPATTVAPSSTAAPTEPATVAVTSSVPPGPEGLAARLTAIETRIRSGSAPPPDIAELGRAQQAAYLTVASRPEWVPTVLARVPSPLREVVSDNLSAVADLQRLTPPAPAVPHWRIVGPPPPDELLRYYREGETRFGIPWADLAAVNLVETRMGRIQGTSSAGAQGPMQFLPSTWAQYGEGDIHDPHAAILAAARYLRAAGGPADMGRALLAYNHSGLYVDAVTRYARRMRADERAFLAYYHWPVHVRLTTGDVFLDEGFAG